MSLFDECSSPYEPPAALPWSDGELRQRVQEAVLYHWQGRTGQLEDQKRRGKADAGTRGAVTGGKHLNGFRDLLGDISRIAGYDESEYSHHFGMNLPGYYRATKAWDFIVMRDKQLVAAVEFKSMNGSVGKNLNNRGEEVLGLARDFWMANNKGLLRDAGAPPVGDSPRPWLGYVFLIGEDESLNEPVEPTSTRFPIDPEFENNTYYDRYATLCKRMVLERDYAAVVFMKSRDDGTGHYEEPLTGIDFRTFAHSLYRHLTTWPSTSEQF